MVNHGKPNQECCASEKTCLRQGVGHLDSYIGGFRTSCDRGRSQIDPHTASSGCRGRELIMEDLSSCVLSASASPFSISITSDLRRPFLSTPSSSRPERAHDTAPDADDHGLAALPECGPQPWGRGLETGGSWGVQWVWGSTHQKRFRWIQVKEWYGSSVLQSNNDFHDADIPNKGGR